MKTKNKIREFILNEELSDSTIAIHDDQMLLTDGILDSLSIIRILTYIESEFDVDISSNDINIDDFETINSMALMINRFSSRG